MIYLKLEKVQKKRFAVIEEWYMRVVAIVCAVALSRVFLIRRRSHMDFDFEHDFETEEMWSENVEP